jgi:Leucine-rich repeat (LRR) protein
VVDVLKELETSGLERVVLANMSISNPALFSTLTLMALRHLHLSHNHIAAVPENTFGNVRSLQMLDLSHNPLVQLDEGFQDLINLHTLNMSHCRYVYCTLHSLTQ